jgi:hypothetical protein
MSSKAVMAGAVSTVMGMQPSPGRPPAMTMHEPTPADVALVAIDIAKARNEVLIEVSGQRRRRRLTVLNTRADHDRLVAALESRRVCRSFEP